VFAELPVEVVDHVIAAGGSANLPADAGDVGVGIGGEDAVFAVEFVAAVVVIRLGGIVHGEGADLRGGIDRDGTGEQVRDAEIGAGVRRRCGPVRTAHGQVAEAIGPLGLDEEPDGLFRLGGMDGAIPGNNRRPCGRPRLRQHWCDSAVHAGDDDFHNCPCCAYMVVDWLIGLSM
jgi:hypothetical protein